MITGEWSPRNDIKVVCWVSFYDTQFATHFYECCYAAVQMFAAVSGRELHTYASLALRHHRIVEAGDVYALFLHLRSIYLREFGIIEHHSTDSTLCGLDIKPCSHHLVAEIVHVLYQSGVQLIPLLQHFEHLERSTNNAGGQRVGEEIRT